MRVIIFLLIAVSGVAAHAQCVYEVTGSVYDAQSKTPLPSATILIKETGNGAVAELDGGFRIKNVCTRAYTFVCSFVGYRSDSLRMTIGANATINFSLHPDPTSIAEVIVEGERDKRVLVSAPVVELKGEALFHTRGTTLGESLTGITGVYALQTGPTIFKPVIHGLHSNRVLILNNGVRLEGQQWGSEHAPEIDPFIASKLSVVKGAASIRYGSDAIGGVVSADPAPLPEMKGIGGEVNFVGASNNRMGVTSAILQGAFDKKLAPLSWRVQGTVRRAGNSQTPDYYIENTGFQEVNYSAAAGWRKKKYGVEAFFSRFETKLGIFTGSYANSISDIRQLIGQDRPSTPSYFSYTIQRPYQQVSHTLLKTNAWYNFQNGRLDVIFARQQNDRSEYDFTPLSGRQTPELFLKLVTHTTDAIYTFNARKAWSATAGFNGITQGNVRMYQMLIPNFRNYGGGIFYLAKHTGEKLTVEAGARYDYRWLRAYMLDNNTAKTVPPTYRFQNVTGTLGAEYFLKENISWSLSAGTAWRAPTVSELLSAGVHQSAGDYEKGNPSLGLERAYNLNTSLHFTGKKIHGEIGLYNNIIDGYIFLKPEGTFIHTVRGSKPVFVYTQVNARFRGIDFSTTWDVTDSLSITAKESLLYAWNNTIHDYLQLVPANRFQHSVRYGFGSFGVFRNVYLNVGSIYTAKQNRVPVNSDFLAPPGGYMLMYADAGFGMLFGKHLASVTLSAGNILNVAYRDYMDRFRYYTDEPGRNFTLRLRVPFGSSSL